LFKCSFPTFPPLNRQKAFVSAKNHLKAFLGNRQTFKWTTPPEPPVPSQLSHRFEAVNFLIYIVIFCNVAHFINITCQTAICWHPKKFRLGIVPGQEMERAEGISPQTDGCRLPKTYILVSAIVGR